MYNEHVVAEHLLYVLQYRKHNTAQSARTKPQSNRVPNQVRQRKQSALFPIFYVFVGLFLICTSMLSSIYRKHSTAQRNQPCTKRHCQYVPIRARRRKQADRVGENREPACRRSSSTHTSGCVLKTKKSQSTPPTKICDHSPSSFSWCNARRICLCSIVRVRYTALPLRPFFVFRACMRRPGCFLEHGALGICKSLVCT